MEQKLRLHKYYFYHEHILSGLIKCPICGTGLIGTLRRRKNKIDEKVDVSLLEAEREQVREQLRQVMGAKKKLTEMLDRLDVNDKHYDRK